VTSGQVFRWSQSQDGIWRGVDGGSWFKTERGEVTSNSPPEVFERLFRLDADAETLFPALLAAGPELEPYLDALPGLRVMRPSDPVEALFCFLCTPNNHIKRITAMIDHLAGFGPRGSDGVQRFPEIGAIAAIEESRLRGLGFGYRGATIPHIAAQLLEHGGRSYLAELSRATYREAHQELLSFKGIGPKLADCIALFALDHTEAAPIDTHVWQAVTRLYFPDWRDLPLTDVRYRTAGDFLRNRFGPNAAWAQQFLFYENQLNWRSRR
jgi:N-glycosylase/DNA lyase